MKTLKLLVICLLFISVYSCSKDDDSSEEDIMQQVENFVTPDLIETLEQLGYNFNDGEDSPDIEGQFYYSTVVLQSTNIEGDSPVGSVFNDLEVNFSNLNPVCKTWYYCRR